MGSPTQAKTDQFSLPKSSIEADFLPSTLLESRPKSTANSPPVAGLLVSASLQETNSHAVIIIRRRGQRLPNLL